jgi:hypothetical protein
MLNMKQPPSEVDEDKFESDRSNATKRHLLSHDDSFLVFFLFS